MIQQDPVDRQFAALGYKPDYPPDTIRGVKLNDQQYDDYVKLSGKLSKMQLDQLVAHPQWNNVPDDSKLSVMKATIDKARDIAQTAIMVKYQGSQNDIMHKATNAKLAMMEAARTPEPSSESEPAATPSQ